jgi:hypothetical protein
VTRRQRRRWLLFAAFVLALVPLWIPRSGGSRATLAMRLLGPLARPAALVQWVRVDEGLRDGRTDLALARAETAFALDPTLTQGWFFLSRHLALDLASPEREPDATKRARWVRAALAIAKRGEASADDPAELAFWRGLVLARTAEVDPTLPWDGGTRGMWREAIDAFELAAERGHPDAGGAAQRARTVLDSIGRG